MQSTLHLGLGKRASRPLMATSVPGQSHLRLFFVLERSSHRRFLVDTGAAVSVLPVKSDRQHSQSGVHLLAANGTAILTFGTRSLTLNLGLRQPFRWVFTVADVHHPILGADFLGHHSLLIDIKHKNLIDSTTDLKTNIVCTHQNAHRLTTVNPLFSSNPFHSLLLDFPEVTRSFIDTPIKHDVVHHIVTSGQPVSSRTHRLPPERLTVAKSEFDHMLELGIICPSSSCWSSALHMVPKNLETGDHVEIIVPLTVLRNRTGIPFPTFRI